MNKKYTIEEKNLRASTYKYYREIKGYSPSKAKRLAWHDLAVYHDMMNIGKK